MLDSMDALAMELRLAHRLPRFGGGKRRCRGNGIAQLGPDEPPLRMERTASTRRQNGGPPPSFVSVVRNATDEFHAGFQNLAAISAPMARWHGSCLCRQRIWRSHDLALVLAFDSPAPAGGPPASVEANPRRSATVRSPPWRTASCVWAVQNGLGERPRGVVH